MRGEYVEALARMFASRVREVTQGLSDEEYEYLLACLSVELRVSDD